MKLTADDPAKQRRQLITLGLVIAIGAWLYFAPPWGPVPPPGGPPTAEVRGATSNTPAAGTGGAAATQTMPEPVKLSALKAVSEETSGQSRSIWLWRSPEAAGSRRLRRS